MKKLIIFLLFVLPTIQLYSQINWYKGTWQSLFEKSEQTGKALFIYASNNSNSCWWLEQEVFTDKEISKFYNDNFICVKFINDIDNADFIDDVATINKYPYIIYYEPKSRTGYKSTGDINAEELMNYGKTIANEFRLRKSTLHRINSLNRDTSISVYKVPHNDGRYSLGVNGKRLMYGYPYPNSTSHFIVSANDKIASNSTRFLLTKDLKYKDYLDVGFTKRVVRALKKKRFFQRLFQIFKKKKKKDKYVTEKKSHKRKHKKNFVLKAYKDVEYLSDTLLVKFEGNNSMHSEINFKFNNLKIRQELIPLNKNFDLCRQGDSTKYYRIEYTLKNESDTIIKSGLLVLFDMMIDNNDAAKMDVFGKSTSKKSRLNRKNKGKNIKYTPKDKIKRILVYKNKRKTKDLTGDFRLEDNPDEIHIGSWGHLYSTLWDVSDKLIGKKYHDSAIILKWNAVNIAPGEKKVYSTVFGIYNKGSLDLVPAGTKYSGSDSLGNRVIKPVLKFTADKDTIYEGEKVTLTWSVKNSSNLDVYISTDIIKQTGNSGTITVNPDNDTIFYLKVLDTGKELAKKNVKIVVLKKRKKTDIDGKFTFGNDDFPISFGYPLNHSTSYFTLKTKNKTISNSDNLENTTYIKAKQFVDATLKERNTLTYRTDNFKIVQNLIPCDKNMKPVLSNKPTSYRCEYMIKNITGKSVSVSFSQIMDLPTVINNNSYLLVNKHKLKINNVFKLKDIPEEIIFVSEKNNEVLKINPKNNIGQEAVFVATGENYLLKNMKLNKIESQNAYSNDIAFLINWKKTIAPNDSTFFSFDIIGNKNDKIKYRYHNSRKISEMTINFKIGDAEIDSIGIENINIFLKENKFDFIIIEGFADNKGKEKANYLLARNRINNVGNIITESEIKKAKILRKIYGEFFSNLENKDIETEDKEQRIVKITLYKN